MVVIVLQADIISIVGLFLVATIRKSNGISIFYASMYNLLFKQQKVLV